MHKQVLVLWPFFGACLLLASGYLLLMPAKELRAAPDALLLQVDRLDDPALPTGNGCSLAPNDCTLRGAVSVADEGATIEIVPNGSIVLQQGVITLTKDVTITSSSAQNHVIDGNDTSLIFGIEPDPFAERTVILEELTLQNGFNADDNGGAIRMEDGALTMRHLILQDNVAGRRGGALSVLPSFDHASVILSDVTFRRNRAQSSALSGGAINIRALFEVSATLSIEDSLFEDNIGGNLVGGEGGAIMGDARTPGANLSMTIRATEFISNNSQVGGALSLRTFAVEPGGSSSVNTVIYNSAFIGNQGGQGGAIFHEAAGSQSAATLTISNTTFATNTASSEGGALYTESNQSGGLNPVNSTVRIFNTLFNGNWSTAGDGGAIYQGATAIGIPAPSQAQLELVNVTLSGNRAGSDIDDEGGAIYAFTSDSVGATSRVTATHVTLFDNSASGSSDIGLRQDSSTSNGFYLKNSIVAGGDGASCSNESGTLDGANNLINDTSCGDSSTFRLGNAIGVIPNLASNGGPTLTHGLYANSNALNTVPLGQCTLGNSAVDVTEDQRGEPRPFGANCDIGAFEEQSAMPPDVPAITGLSASNDGPTQLASPTTFDATITGGTVESYAWDFGDGNTGSGKTPSHTYTETGVYTASVTATNITNSLTATTTVYVGNAVVEVGNNFYDPSEITVPLGSMVVWVLRSGGVAHSVTADDGNFEQPASSNWPPFIQTFDSDDTIDYHCSVHGLSMAGKVIVGTGAVPDDLRLPTIIKQEE